MFQAKKHVILLIPSYISLLILKSQYKHMTMYYIRTICVSLREYAQLKVT